MHFTVDEILEATGGQLTKPEVRLPTPVIITGVSTDTRTLRDGDLFVPLRGPRADGHDFIAEAFHRGAAAALSVRPLNGLPSGAVVIRVDDALRALGRIARAYRRTLTVTVVGVTGSVGKTTTTKLCAAVLGRAFAVASTKEVWNAEIGVPLTLLGLTVEHGVAVIEMAMRGLGQIAELVEMAAPSVGRVWGMDLAAMAAGMAGWTPPAMRLQPMQLDDILVINDAYNSSPSSVRAALDVLEEAGRGHRLVAVLGEMRELGAQSPELHRDVGRDVARRKIAFLLAVGGGAGVIGEGAAAGGMESDRIEHAPSLQAATTRLPTPPQ